MSGTSNGVYVYAGYVLVEEREEFEYRYAWVAIPPVFSKTLKRRSVHTMTWEATLQETYEDESSSDYNHEQGYPGSVNPGGLGSDWRLYSVEYSRTMSTPFSKVVRETWVKTGAWTTVPDADSSSSN